MKSIIEILANKYLQDEEADSALMTETDKFKKYGPIVKTFKSSSNPNKEYEVRRIKGDEPTCNCPGWANRKTCRHVEDVKKLKIGASSSVEYKGFSIDKSEVDKDENYLVTSASRPLSPEDAVSDLLGRYFDKRSSSILEATKKVMANDKVTLIDFKQPISKIKNLKELPENIQEAIKSADHIQSKGFQELLGYNKSNKIIWSAGGHWDGRENKPTEKFVVENFGGMLCPTCKQSSIQWHK